MKNVRGSIGAAATVVALTLLLYAGGFESHCVGTLFYTWLFMTAVFAAIVFLIVEELFTDIE